MVICVSLFMCFTFFFSGLSCIAEFQGGGMGGSGRCGEWDSSFFVDARSAGRFRIILQQRRWRSRDYSTRKEAIHQNTEASCCDVL